METKVKNYSRDGRDYQIEAKYGWHKLEGNRYAHFSITGEIMSGRHGGKLRWESGGCIHSEIEESFPELAELIPFHLFDSQAMPLHYIANGLYWAELASGVSDWQEITSVPHGHDSFEGVFLSHCAPINETDRIELFRNLAGYRLAVNNGISKKTAGIDLKKFLESRIVGLRCHMAEVMDRHGIEIPSK